MKLSWIHAQLMAHPAAARNAWKHSCIRSLSLWQPCAMRPGLPLRSWDPHARRTQDEVWPRLQSPLNSGWGSYTIMRQPFRVLCNALCMNGRNTSHSFSIQALYVMWMTPEYLVFVVFVCFVLYSITNVNVPLLYIMFCPFYQEYKIKIIIFIIFTMLWLHQLES